MANSTARTAKQIHGTNPQFLIEKVIRSRIYDSPYWKEHCFALNAASFVDRALNDLTYIGGTYGLQKPTPFICLVCKLLQIQPDRQIILEYLRHKQFKYLRAVAAMYVRLTFTPLDVFETLEPLLNDYSKLRFRQMNGQYTLTYMDEFVDQLLIEERVCELILPRLTRRDVLEEVEGLVPRISKLEDAMLSSTLQRGDQDSDASSDDSARAEREEKQKRVQRALKIRQTRKEEEERRARILENAKSTARAKEESGESEGSDEFGSQEESDQERLVSRSPSRSGSEKNRYQSRSPSRSP
ncbi:Pre-mRNA-splicing factor 38A, partial [Meira miltonrushii]